MVEDHHTRGAQQIDRLQRVPPGELARAVATKRLAWLAQQAPTPPLERPVTPRQAFARFFFDYLGLAAHAVPIIAETATELSWRSLNPCPTLDACVQLGLDTRQVCRAVYAPSTQAFFSALDPELRFLRSYTQIRPYADACVERIVRVDFIALMQQAITIAQHAQSTVPGSSGAVIVFGQDVLGRGHDTLLPQRHHAVITALDAAIQAHGDGNLTGAILVTTMEPCSQCLARAVAAKLTTIVSGASRDDLGTPDRATPDGWTHTWVPTPSGMIERINGICRTACQALYR